jgi:hypothetical protein
VVGFRFGQSTLVGTGSSLSRELIDQFLKAGAPDDKIRTDRHSKLMRLPLRVFDEVHPIEQRRFLLLSVGGDVGRGEVGKGW